MAPKRSTTSTMSGWKDLVAAGLYRTGMLRAIQGFSRYYELRTSPGRALPRLHKVSGPKFAILCYHRVGSGGVPLYSELAPEVFEAQMRFLRRHYRIVSLDQLYREIQNPITRDQAVAITFDDGYGDLYTHAFPILRKYQIPATIYLIVSSIETGEAAWYDRIFVALQSFSGDQLEVVFEKPRSLKLDSFEARIQAGVEIVGYLRTLPDARRREWCALLEERIPVPAGKLSNCMLTWEQIKTMHQAGIAFGSHTMTHPVFSRVPPPEMVKELSESKEIIEAKIGSAVSDFAYPFGMPRDCGHDGAKLLAHCGYRTAVTTSEDVNTTGADPYFLRRTQIGEQCSLAMFALRLRQRFFQDNYSERPNTDTIISPRLDQNTKWKSKEFQCRY